MKYTLILLLMLCFSATAQRSGFGIGIIAGEPTGICGKSWLSSTTAIDGALAWSLDEDGSMHIHGSYLRHSSTFEDDEPGLLLHYGLGGRILFLDDDDERIGPRVPVGLCYCLEDPTIDIFVEVAPVLDLIPETELQLNGGIGARLYL